MFNKINIYYFNALLEFVKLFVGPFELFSVERTSAPHLYSTSFFCYFFCERDHGKDHYSGG